MQESAESMARSCEACADLSAQLYKARGVIARQRAQIMKLSDNLQSEKEKTAMMENVILKMETDLQTYDFAVKQEEPRNDDVDDAAGPLEEFALMTLNPRGAAATRSRGRRCGIRSAAAWRGGPPRGRGRGSSVGVDAPHGTNVNISLHY